MTKKCLFPKIVSFNASLGNTLQKLGSFEDSGYCPEILDYTLKAFQKTKFEEFGRNFLSWFRKVDIENGGHVKLIVQGAGPRVPRLLPPLVVRQKKPLEPENLTGLNFHVL